MAPLVLISLPCLSGGETVPGVPVHDVLPAAVRLERGRVLLCHHLPEGGVVSRPQLG